MKHKTLIIKRPWGKFEQFTHNEQSTVKIITVKAGARLSYQSHQKREEFWRCIKNSVKVTLDGKQSNLAEGDEIYIPLGAKHRLIGTEKEGQILEISWGDFDEDDIVRYEDDFGRA